MVSLDVWILAAVSVSLPGLLLGGRIFGWNVGLEADQQPVRDQALDQDAAADVLDVAAKDAREIKMLEAERRTNMASYVVVIYVGMFVFLAIVLILCTSFIPAMVGGEGSQGMQGLMGGGGAVTQDDITAVFYLACLIQAFGSALVAGVFEDGQFSSSIKHIFIMVLLTWLSFKMLMGV